MMLNEEVFFKDPRTGGLQVDGTWKLASAWSEYHELQVMEKEQHLDEDVNFAFMSRGADVSQSYDISDEDLAYLDDEDDDDDDDDDGEDLEEFDDGLFFEDFDDEED